MSCAFSKISKIVCNLAIAGPYCAGYDYHKLMKSHIMFAMYYTRCFSAPSRTFAGSSTFSSLMTYKSRDCRFASGHQCTYRFNRGFFERRVLRSVSYFSFVSILKSLIQNALNQIKPSSLTSILQFAPLLSVPLHRRFQLRAAFIHPGYRV